MLADLAALASKLIAAASEIAVVPKATSSQTLAAQSGVGPGNSGDSQSTPV